LFDAASGDGGIPPGRPSLMADTYEFAVFGSTPIAGLVAGLLATAHGKRVCLVGEAGSAFRLPRSLDLAAMPVTRPETWALLKATTPEVVKLIGRLGGRSGMQRADAIFAADGRDSSEALSHMRYVAAGFGYAVERLPNGGGLVKGDAYRLRDLHLLRRAVVEPAIDAWLKRANVGQLATRDVMVTLRRDGSARIGYAGSTIEAAHAVLADDSAILSHLEVPERDRTLVLQTATAMLTAPTHALTAPVMIYPDRGVALSRNRRGGVVAFSTGPAEQALVQVGRCLAGHGPLRRAGQHIFRTVATVDGAPLVGPARGIRATVIAGLGVSAAFFAPALARLIAGVASETEAAYFGARQAGRGNARALVADYAAPVLEAQN
jgi:hypothetical protein